MPVNSVKHMISTRCVQGRALQPVLSLAARCPQLLEGSDPAPVLCCAVEQGQNDLAADIVRQLPLPEQVLLSLSRLTP